MEIAVIGLGKLGFPMAAWLASEGHRVHGVDVQEEVVRAANSGRAFYQEAMLDVMMEKAGSNFTASMDTQAAVRSSELIFVVVPTPSNADGAFSLRYVRAACQNIAQALKENTGDNGIKKIIVIVSTVMPGHMAEIMRTLAHISGKRVGIDFGLCYNPEFIALGDVIGGLSKPDLVLIGVSDVESGKRLIWFYRDMGITAPIKVMNCVNAELAKLYLNTMVTAKISMANELAMLCDRIEGADCDVVAEAVGCDSRIGHKYLRGGLPFGGPCFPRDVAALHRVGLNHGLELVQPRATDTINKATLLRLIAKTEEWVTPDSKVGVLGIAYKIGAPLTIESAAWGLAEYFSAMTFDPMAPHSHELEEILDSCDVVIVGLPLPLFRQLSVPEGAKVDRESLPEGIALIPFGRKE